MSKHTPGPWEAQRWDVYRGDDRVAIACQSHINTPEAKANARLIAAAPDLLAALKQLASMAESGARAYDDNELRDLLIGIDNYARAAIAKAEAVS